MAHTFTEAELERFRQSGIRLDADGHFWHEGAQVTHEGMRAAFYRWLDRNPDGRWVLRLDDHRFVYLDVDDTPYAVSSLRLEGNRVFVRLSDGSEEELAYDSLVLRGEHAYAKVKGGRFEARLTRAAWSALGDRLEERDGTPVLITPTGARPLAAS